MNNTFYITTPIYYPSRKFTLGNCYTTVICDAIARFNKMLGKDVFFLTGTDEHGQKISASAKSAGKTEMEYLDEIIADAKNLWQMLDINYDKFIRTTDDYHEKAVQKIFTELYEKGYIYKGKYQGLYCTPCESFWTESQLVDGKCPDCGRPVIAQEEEAYFFKLSAFTDRLLKLYKDHPEFLEPQTRVNEMVNNFLKPGLSDLCVSRTSVKWGVPVEFDQRHTIYVWIDALFNYMTALGFKSDDETLLKKYWPANVHIIGKEIVRFHAIIWPALLMALDLPLPKRIFGHGWMLFGGDKLSKSKQVDSFECVDPRILVPKYSSDAVRYILLREIPFGSDGNYSTEAFLTRFNADLVNNYGNLVSRSFSMLKKYNASIIPEFAEPAEEDKELQDGVDAEIENVYKHMENFDVSKSLMSIFNIFSLANKYIEQTEPFRLAKIEEKKARLDTILRNLLEVIRKGSLLLYPYLPNSAKKALSAFDIDPEVEGFKSLKENALSAGKEINQISMLFPRLDIPAEIEDLKKLSQN